MPTTVDRTAMRSPGRQAKPVLAAVLATGAGVTTLAHPLASSRISGVPQAEPVAPTELSAFVARLELPPTATLAAPRPIVPQPPGITSRLVQPERVTTMTGPSIVAPIAALPEPSVTFAAAKPVPALGIIAPPEAPAIAMPPAPTQPALAAAKPAPALGIIAPPEAPAIAMPPAPTQPALAAAKPAPALGIIAPPEAPAIAMPPAPTQPALAAAKPAPALGIIAPPEAPAIAMPPAPTQPALAAAKPAAALGIIAPLEPPAIAMPPAPIQPALAAAKPAPALGIIAPLEPPAIAMPPAPTQPTLAAAKPAPALGIVAPLEPPAIAMPPAPTQPALAAPRPAPPEPPRFAASTVAKGSLGLGAQPASPPRERMMMPGAELKAMMVAEVARRERPRAVLPGQPSASDARLGAIGAPLPARPSMDRPAARASRQAYAAPDRQTDGVGQSQDAIHLNVAARINGKAAGTVPLLITGNDIAVRLADVLGLLKPLMQPAEFAALSDSSSASEYVTLKRLRAAGIPVRFAEHDQLILGR